MYFFFLFFLLLTGFAREKPTFPHELRDREETSRRGNGPSAENSASAVRR